MTDDDAVFWDRLAEMPAWEAEQECVSRREALVLRQYDDARAAIKNLVEMPDQDADRIIRSLKEGHWQVSNKLRKTLPQVFSEEGALYARHEQIVAAVKAVFENDEKP